MWRGREAPSCSEKGSSCSFFQEAQEFPGGQGTVHGRAGNGGGWHQRASHTWERAAAFVRLRPVLLSAVGPVRQKKEVQVETGK